MPERSVPEVRLRDRLPEGLRDMTMDDIQKALPDLRLPRIDLGRDAARAQRSAEKATARAAKRAEKAARDVEKAAARRAEKAARSVESVLPRRAGPNPVPIAIFAMLGGLVVGWILATNPVTGPRISRWLDDLRTRYDSWRGRGSFDEEEDWETTEPRAYPESLRADIEPERFAGTLPEQETGVGVGPGTLPEGMGTNDPAAVGADERTG